LSGQESRWGLRWAFGVYNVFDWRYSVPVSNEFRQNTIVQNGRTFLATANVTF
jgi:outer membrane receptor protein involved in Fe transport